MVFPEPLVAGELSLLAEPGPPLVVHWVGKATLRNAVAELAPWTAGLIAEAQKSGSVELRFEKLQHANSSTILAIVKLAQQLLTTKVRVRIRYDADQRWQKFTFESFSGFDRSGQLLELAGGA